MSKESNKENEYEEVISSKPSILKTITKEQSNLLAENGLIIGKLREKNHMTVKEIYSLYWDTEQNKYTKTLKTIYRYLELLEQSELIKVSGRRKYKGSRAWERIYCRTAIIYYPEGKDKEISYWETEKGKMLLDIITDIFFEYHGLSSKKKDAFKQLYISYDEIQSKIVWEILTGTEENEIYESLLSKVELDEIKFIVSSSAKISAALLNAEILSKIQKILDD